MTDPSKPAYTSRQSYRLITAAIGLALFGLGIYILLFGPAGALIRVAIGIVLLLLGGNAMFAAWRSRESWLSRLGPLP